MAPFDNHAQYMDMGPSLLALQPVIEDQRPQKEKEGWQATFNHLQSRMEGMRTWRWSWWSTWGVLAEYFVPRRYKWFITANNMTRGRYLNDAIVDSTGTLAVQTCYTGLWSGLTPPSRDWFKIQVALMTSQIDAAAKNWLEDTQRRIKTVFAQSNFYAATAQMFQDVTVFGTSPMIMYEDAYDVIRCYIPCAGEYFLAAGARFSTDVFAREFTLTIAQTIDMFGVENCPPQVQALWQTGGGSLENEVVICHMIEPNTEIKARGKKTASPMMVPEHFPYREIYWMRGSKSDKPLSARGFHGAPFFVARWAQTSNDPYGRGPCFDALGDQKQLQLETRRKAEFIEKLVRPPMLADPALKNEPASIVPGHVTYVNTATGAPGFKPAFEVNAQALTPMVLDIKEIQTRIKDCLFVNLFMAISQMQGVQPRNELELTKRDLERLQQLGPFIEQYQTEFAGPAIMRCMNIMERRGLLLPRPPSLKGVAIKIAYESIMEIASRAAETVAMKDFFQTSGGLSAAAKAAGVPDPLRTVKLDESLQYYGGIGGFPAHLFYTEKEVAEHDQIRTEEIQKQKAAENVIPATVATTKAAQTLSQTPVPGGNALNALLTGATGSR